MSISSRVRRSRNETRKCKKTENMDSASSADPGDTPQALKNKYLCSGKQQTDLRVLCRRRF